MTSAAPATCIARIDSSRNSTNHVNAITGSLAATSAAGALGGTAQSVEALESAARSLQRPVRQRTTLYSAVPACV